MKGLKLGSAVLAVLAFLACGVIAQDTPKTIRGGVLNGKAVSLPKPVYPDQARVAKVGGTISVEVVIDETGTVASVAAVTPERKPKESLTGDEEQQEELLDLLRHSAEEAAKLARFSPTLLNGTPVKVTGSIIYNFSPDNPDGPMPKVISGGVLNEKAISLPHPEYPPAAKAVNATGAVSVQVLIDENGDVISASVVSGHPLLRPAAEAAARKAKFSPTLLSGTPVKVSGILTYKFSLPKKDEQ